MDTMYEQILLLPIFQGISKSELTDILEKVHFNFAKYSNKGEIVKRGTMCKNVLFLLSGEIEVETFSINRKIHIVQYLSAPMTLPFNHLYGIDTNNDITVKAVGKVGIMSLDKSEFLFSLQGNKILLINVLNILSSRAQRLDYTMEHFSRFNETERFAWWLKTKTIPQASNITIKADADELCRALMLDRNLFWKALSRLEEIGAVEYRGETLKLLDRYALRSILGEKLMGN